MSELLAYIMGMGRCSVCGDSVTGDDPVIISDDSDNAVVWHRDCAPIPEIAKVQAECRMMARWN